MSTVPAHLKGQWERLTNTHPNASVVSLPDNTVLVTVPEVRLPPGWSQQTTAIDFIIPVGYPAARPDCFYADANLRLASGGMPASSGANQLPHLGQQRLWFSWHVSSWQPGRDDLLTYVGVIQNRLNRPQ